MALWGYFVWTGTVSTIWPMLGVTNQMLAAFALAIGTSWLINQGRARYVWVTLVPLAFMCVNTLIAGWMNIGVNYLRPQLLAGAPGWAAAFAAAPVTARVQCVVTLVVMALLVVVVVDCALRWSRALSRGERVDSRVAVGAAGRLSGPPPPGPADPSPDDARAVPGPRYLHDGYTPDTGPQSADRRFRRMRILTDPPQSLGSARRPAVHRPRAAATPGARLPLRQLFVLVLLVLSFALSLGVMFRARHEMASLPPGAHETAAAAADPTSP